MSTPPPLYSDEQAALILRRAALLQEHPRSSSSAFTLEQLQEIAAEAGIDPRHVAEVAARLAVPGDSWARVLRAPTRFHYSHTERGEIADDDWEEAIRQVRESLGTSGIPVLLPRRLEWRSNGEATPPLLVRVATGGGETRLEINGDLRGEALARVVLPSSGGGIFALMIGDVVLGLPDAGLLAALLLGVSGGFAAGTSLWRRASAAWERRLERLLSRLAALPTPRGGDDGPRLRTLQESGEEARP